MPRNPISVRLNDVQQRELDNLGGTQNASAVIQEALSRMAALKTSCAPLYARLVDDPRVEEAVEEAVSAACKRLDELFPEGRGKEYKGISSNFQGLLGLHIRAMLTGVESCSRAWRTELNALLATEDAFGRFPYGTRFSHDIGFTVVKLAKRHGEEDLFLNSDRDYCRIESLPADVLFTSPADCAKGALNWMEERDLSPRTEDARLCAIRITDTGPLEVVAVAALGSESSIDEQTYRGRILAKKGGGQA